MLDENRNHENDHPVRYSVCVYVCVWGDGSRHSKKDMEGDRVDRRLNFPFFVNFIFAVHKKKGNPFVTP